MNLKIFYRGKKMSKIIGIDLGTSNCCVSVFENGSPVVIASAEGFRTTPSIVAFGKNGECLVGHDAKRQAITNPEKTISSIKCFVGRTVAECSAVEKNVPYKLVGAGSEPVQVQVDSKRFTSSEVLAKLFQNAKKMAEDYLAQPVTLAVVTVPACFNFFQQEAVKEAGKIAGLEVLRVINESTAAALVYGLDCKEKKNVVMYNLGGGFCNVSVLVIDDGMYDVKASNGCAMLGGDQFDEVVMDWIYSEFKKDNPEIDLKKDKVALQRLKETAEMAKIDLSATTSTNINLPFITADASGLKHINLTLSRTKFDQLTAHLVEHSVDVCRKTIKDSGLSLSEIDDVLLIGASTRIPAVQEAVRKFFGKEPNKTVNPDESPAMGAAIEGACLSGDSLVKDALLLDVLSHSVGVEMHDGTMAKLIDHNTTIPTKKSMVFSTTDDKLSSVMVHVLQGESTLACENQTLCTLVLKDLPSVSWHGKRQVEVTLDIGAFGGMFISARDKISSREQSVKIVAGKKIVAPKVLKGTAALKYNEPAFKDVMTVGGTARFVGKCVGEAFGIFGDHSDMPKNGTSKQMEEPSNKNKYTENAGLGAGINSAAQNYADNVIFTAERGHGIAAEKANHMYDKFMGKDAKLVGGDNALNGADRLVDGIEIQSKYCRTGSKCIEECFDSAGKFRYMAKNGSPMQIEVPSDKYQDAVQAMENRIRRGQIPGVSDPNEARNIVKKGAFTYEQVKNIAKFGTVESLTYDAVNGISVAFTSLGVSSVLTFATSIWNGSSVDDAAEEACLVGLKVGGVTWISSVLSAQLGRTGLEQGLRGATDAAVKFMGPKAASYLAAGSGKALYGAAAANHVSKLLRGNFVTAIAVTAVLSSVDLVRLFNGKISGAQLFKNVAKTASGVAGGTGGWFGGAAAGATLGSIIPGVGNVVGGIVGGVVGAITGGAVASEASGAILDGFIKDDAEEMLEIVQNQFVDMCTDYLLGEEDAKKVMDRFKDRDIPDFLRDMYASSNREQFAKNALLPIVEDVARHRKPIKLPSDEKILESFGRLANKN